MEIIAWSIFWLQLTPCIQIVELIDTGYYLELEWDLILSVRSARSLTQKQHAAETRLHVALLTQVLVLNSSGII
jgi:hypothetical protein